MLMLILLVPLFVIPAYAETFAVGVYTTENINKLLSDYNLLDGKYWGYYTSESGASTSYRGIDDPVNTWTSNNKYGKYGKEGTWGYSYGGGEECFGFIAFVGAKLSGIDISSNIGPQDCPDKWQAYSVSEIEAAGGLHVGDIIQVRNASGGHVHSSMVLSIDDTGYIHAIQAYGGDLNKIVVGTCFSSGVAGQIPDFDTLKAKANDYRVRVFRAKNYNGSGNQGSGNGGNTVQGFDPANPDLTLPSSLVVIEEDAFSAISISSVTFPEGLERIEKGAFRDCENLKSVYIPASVNSIDDEAFDGCADDLIIYGQANSVAQTYARTKGYQFYNARIKTDENEYTRISTGGWINYSRLPNPPAIDTLLREVKGLDWTAYGTACRFEIEGYARVEKGTVDIYWISKDGEKHYIFCFSAPYDNWDGDKLYFRSKNIEGAEDITLYMEERGFNGSISFDTYTLYR